MSASLPLPPLELRELVGLTETSYYDNPEGAPVFGAELALDYDSVFDFGCGCGRLARQLAQARVRPRRYLGIDLHAGLVRWCRTHLAPVAAGFEFQHHDVRNVGLNPAGSATQLPFPVPDAWATLVIAWSVFTHLTQDQASFYLREAARVLAPQGALLSTWFLFDKAAFPMMQPFQNALFINDVDPSNAVIFDRAWLRATWRACGLRLVHAQPPIVRGYQWRLLLRPESCGWPEVELPADLGPLGRKVPPLLRAGAHKLGLEPDEPA